MADRNRELVPDNWSLVRERALTTGSRQGRHTQTHTHTHQSHIRAMRQKKRFLKRERFSRKIYKS